MVREPETSAGVCPGGTVGGAMALPSSKSIAQRLLVAAALAQGETHLLGLSDGDDVRSLRTALASLGVILREGRAGEVHVRGGLHPEGSPTVEVGESGTAARLLTAAVALTDAPGQAITLVPQGSLRRRSSAALFDALEAAGARLGRRADQGAGWPLTLGPIPCPANLSLDQPGSSQEVSALLFALAARSAEGTLLVRGPIPSAPYVDLTLGVLHQFGVTVTREGGEFHVSGEMLAPAGPCSVEPDASAAAVALAAGCLTGGRVRIPGLGSESLQGDVRILEYLRAFGCQSKVTAEGLEAWGTPSRGADLDLGSEPDLAPVLAAVAGAVALSNGETSQLLGLETLQGKESARLDVLAEGLSQAGIRAVASDRTLTIGPGSGRPSPQETVTLDPRGDHRMVFAFALLGLVTPGIRILDPSCVAKSWPGFWEDLAAAGGRVER